MNVSNLGEDFAILTQNSKIFLYDMNDIRDWAIRTYIRNILLSGFEEDKVNLLDRFALNGEISYEHPNLKRDNDKINLFRVVSVPVKFGYSQKVVSKVRPDEMFEDFFRIILELYPVNAGVSGLEFYLDQIPSEDKMFDDPWRRRLGREAYVKQFSSDFYKTVYLPFLAKKVRKKWGRFKEGLENLS